MAKKKKETEVSEEIEFFMESFYRKEDKDYKPSIEDLESDLYGLIIDDFDKFLEEVSRAMRKYKK